MNFARIVLWLFGGITLAFGAWSLADPVGVSGLLKYELLTAGAATELRSFYGGVELGLAAFWIAGGLRAELLRAALVSMVLVWGAVVLSRVYGLIVDGSASTTLFVVLAVEVLSAVAAYVALSRLPATR